MSRCPLIAEPIRAFLTLTHPETYSNQSRAIDRERLQWKFHFMVYVTPLVEGRVFAPQHRTDWVSGGRLLNLSQTLLRRFGIAAHMYYPDVGRHGAAHIHVFYADEEATLRIPNGGLLEGRQAHLRARACCDR